MKLITDEDIEKAAFDFTAMISDPENAGETGEYFDNGYKMGVVRGAKWVRDQQPKPMTWIRIKSEKDCPGKDYRDHPRKYILRVMHDDGRGGNHIETPEATDIWDIARQNDGAVYWLNEDTASIILHQEPKPDPKECEPGYYWVKVKDHQDWEIAQLDHKSGEFESWSIMGNECGFYPEDFSEIGPRIENFDNA